VLARCPCRSQTARKPEAFQFFWRQKPQYPIDGILVAREDTIPVGQRPRASNPCWDHSTEPVEVQSPRPPQSDRGLIKRPTAGGIVSEAVIDEPSFAVSILRGETETDCRLPVTQNW